MLYPAELLTQIAVEKELFRNAKIIIYALEPKVNVFLKKISASGFDRDFVAISFVNEYNGNHERKYNLSGNSN